MRAVPRPQARAGRPPEGGDDKQRSAWMKPSQHHPDLGDGQQRIFENRKVEVSLEAVR